MFKCKRFTHKSLSSNRDFPLHCIYIISSFRLNLYHYLLLIKEFTTKRKLTKNLWIYNPTFWKTLNNGSIKFFDLSIKRNLCSCWDLWAISNHLKWERNLISHRHKSWQIRLQQERLIHSKFSSLSTKLRFLWDSNCIDHPSRQIIWQTKLNLCFSSFSYHRSISKCQIIKLFSQIFQTSISSTSSLLPIGKEGSKRIIQILPVWIVHNCTSNSIKEIRNRFFNLVIQIHKRLIYNAKRNPSSYRLSSMISCLNLYFHLFSWTIVCLIRCELKIYSLQIFLNHCLSISGKKSWLRSLLVSTSSKLTIYLFSHKLDHTNLYIWIKILPYLNRKRTSIQSYYLFF